MIDVKETILDVLEDLGKDFIKKHEDLGMKATGQWSESVEVKLNDFGGFILANDYTEQLVQGRRPGSRPPITPLEEWVQAKFGLRGKEATSAAWAISTKIANEGTTWYQKGGSDLIDGVLTPERELKVLQSIGESITITVRDSLIRAFNKTTAA